MRKRKNSSLRTKNCPPGLESFNLMTISIDFIICRVRHCVHSSALGHVRAKTTRADQWRNPAQFSSNGTIDSGLPSVVWPDRNYNSDFPSTQSKRTGEVSTISKEQIGRHG